MRSSLFSTHLIHSSKGVKKIKTVITLLLLTLITLSFSQTNTSTREPRIRGPFLFTTTSVQEDVCIWQNFSEWNGIPPTPKSYNKECPSFAGYPIYLTREGTTRKLGIKQGEEVIYFQDAIWKSLGTETPYTITNTLEWTYTFNRDGTPFIKAIIYTLESTDFNYMQQRVPIGIAVVNLIGEPCLETVAHNIEDARNVANYLVDSCTSSK